MRAYTTTRILLLIAVLSAVVLPSAVGEEKFIVGRELQKGKKLFNEQKYDEAEAVFKLIREHDPENTLAIHYLGRIELERHRTSKAIKLLEEAADANPESPGFSYWLGMAYAEKAYTSGLLKKASFGHKMKKIWQKALQLDPGNHDARLNMIVFYLEAPGIAGGSVDAAEAHVDTLLQYYPESFEGRTAKCRILEDRKKYEEAEECYRALYEENPRHYAILRTYGMFYINRENYLDAERIFYDYVQVYPTFSDARYCLGLAYEGQKRWKEAAEQFELAIQYYPEYEDAKDHLKKVKKKLK